MDTGALDAKGTGQGPDAEVTWYNCSKVGHRKADCLSWQAAQKDKEKEKQAAKKDAAPKKGAKKEVAASGSSGEETEHEATERTLLVATRPTL